MARSIPNPRYNSKVPINYEADEVNKFLENPRNVDFLYTRNKEWESKNAFNRKKYENGRVRSPDYISEKRSLNREPINDFHGYNTYQATRGQHIANGKASTNEVNDGRYEEYTPASSPSGYRFNRNDKSRKSTLKQAISSFVKLWRPQKHRDDSRMYIGSKEFAVSAHTVNRSGSMKSNNASLHRNHSFSAPRNRDRSQSINSKEVSTPSRQLSPKQDLLKEEKPLAPQRTLTPSKSNHAFERSIPCKTGIANLGNTCYMNSVLQCLACTDKFAQLFVTDNYLKYLSHTYSLDGIPNNPSDHKSVSVALAATLQHMWFNANTDNVALKLSHVIADNNPNFAHSCQQDAQEFLIWLLDKIHEEIKDEKCKNHCMVRAPLFNQESRSEDELADDALTRHQNGNCSIIIKLFCAQFRSSIECESCRFRNLSFDPYRNVSLTVSPVTNMHSFAITWISYDVERTRVRYDLHIKIGGTIQEMLKLITGQPNMKDKLCVPCLQLMSGTLQLLDLKAQLPRNSPIFLLEIPNTAAAHSEKEYVVALCSFASGFGYDSRRHGPPFVVVLHRLWNYNRILSEIISRGSDLVRVDDHYTTTGQCKVVVGDNSILEPHYREPIQVCVPDRIFNVIRLTVKVNTLYSEHFFEAAIPKPEISTMITAENYVTLKDLLHDYVQPEVLEWKCNKCLRNKGKKQLKFHSLPPVLVFHLKRFHLEEDGSMRRVDRPLKIPLEGLDMKPYICRPDSKPNTLRNRPCKIDSEINNADHLIFGADEYIYDLVGVVNHYGDRINSGHYTAITKNPLDGQWREFDDMRVSTLSASNLVYSSHAYLLFYEKRQPSIMSARTRPTQRHWFHDVSNEIEERCLKSRVNNLTKSENHASGVKTLPRPSWTSYVNENGTNKVQSPELLLELQDRSRSLHNLSMVKHDNGNIL